MSTKSKPNSGFTLNPSETLNEMWITSSQKSNPDDNITIRQKIKKRRKRQLQEKKESKSNKNRALKQTPIALTTNLTLHVIHRLRDREPKNKSPDSKPKKVFGQYEINTQQQQETQENSLHNYWKTDSSTSSTAVPSSTDKTTSTSIPEPEPYYTSGWVDKVSNQLKDRDAKINQKRTNQFTINVSDFTNEEEKKTVIDVMIEKSKGRIAEKKMRVSEIIH